MYLTMYLYSLELYQLDRTMYNGKFAEMQDLLTENKKYQVVEKCERFSSYGTSLLWIDCPQPQCGRKGPQTLQQASLKASPRSTPIKNQLIQRRSPTDTDGSWTFLDELSLQSPGIMAVIYQYEFN